MKSEQAMKVREKILKANLRRAQAMIDSIDPKESQLGMDLSKKYRSEYNRFKQQKYYLNGQLS